MNVLKVSLSNVKHRPLTALLSVLLLAFGVGIILLLVSTSEKLEKQFTKNIAGIDMVVGAKGSPLQLILSSVYHIDAPTGNIPLDEFEKLKKNRLIEKAIPLSYGDNYGGYRIVGTTKDYPLLYNADLEKGEWWQKEAEVVIGAQVARLKGLKIGDQFTSSHGLSEGIDEHDHFHYKVVGIMKESETVIDKLILTQTSSVWAVHSHDGEDSPKEITAGLVSFKSPMGNLTIPRMVNQNTSMQAALPAIEVNRLFSLMGTGIKTLRALAILIISLSAISVFISQVQALKDRKTELALMRSLGASRIQIFGLVLFEGIIISLIGYFVGILFGKIALAVIANMAEGAYQYQIDFNLWGTTEAVLLALAIGIGIVAAIIPALQAYKISISKVLADA